MNKSIRQGDVLLHPVASIPAGAKPMKPRDRGYVVADGEVTGHAHVLNPTDCELYTGDDGEMYIRVFNQTELRHDCPGQTVPDHSPLPLAPGTYKYVPQCEELAGDVRRVID